MKRALLIIGGILLLPLLALLYYQIFVFHITGTNPDTKRVSNISPFIDIHFNKPLDGENIEIDVTEGPITGFSVVNGKTLRVGLGPMDVKQEYMIEISKVRARNGDELLNKTIRFTTRDIPFDKLPKGQKTEILKAQDSPNGAKADPILSYLPYDGLNYRLEAVFDNDNLTVDAELILSAADVRIDRNSAIEKYKTQVRDYITSIGLKPDSYNIQYKVTEPSIY